MVSKYFNVPFADTGDKTSVPDAVQAGGEVSYSQGYGPDYQRDPSTDPQAIRIERQQYNQVLNDVTMAIKELQEMGVPTYRADVNYSANISYVVGSDSSVYRALQDNGPSSSVVDPVGDMTGVWSLYNSINQQVFTSSGTYTKPTGVRTILVEVCGGGGGGGASGSASNRGGFGGGGGGYSRILIDADSITSESITIGAGGVGGVAPSGTGLAGGTSSFGSLVSATGGTGGPPGNIASTPGEGGTGLSGDINVSGGGGTSGGQNSDVGGGGGNSYFGGGAAGNSGNSAGRDALTGAFGGGGGGASTENTSASNGGSGESGVVIVTEYR